MAGWARTCDDTFHGRLPVLERGRPLPGAPLPLLGDAPIVAPGAITGSGSRPRELWIGAPPAGDAATARRKIRGLSLKLGWLGLGVHVIGTGRLGDGDPILGPSRFSPPRARGYPATVPRLRWIHGKINKRVLQKFNII